MMIAKKALELLNDVEFSEKYQGIQEYAEMLIVCKEALEKQIPKKLHFGEALGYKDIYWSGYFDGLIALYKEYRQKIDWSEVEK